MFVSRQQIQRSKSTPRSKSTSRTTITKSVTVYDVDDDTNRTSSFGKPLIQKNEYSSYKKSDLVMRSSEANPEWMPEKNGQRYIRLPRSKGQKGDFLPNTKLTLYDMTTRNHMEVSVYSKVQLYTDVKAILLDTGYNSDDCCHFPDGSSAPFQSVVTLKVVKVL